MVPQDDDSPAPGTAGFPIMSGDEWSDLAERTEALAMQRLLTEQAPETVKLLGVSAPDLADGVQTVVVRDPMWGYWNKALGFCATVTEATVEEAVTRGREQGVPALALQIQPRALPDDWDTIVARHGLTQGTTFVKCFGPAEPRDAETDLRIERLAGTGPRSPG
jgi:hypothetical protein